ncbi:hypothetical protein GLOTRDRAFT_139704 [Gloeophyllum trabeum ATCC 11539]|uniref:Uncharacterized protein n=1 Tax=Gloeophyllum trabeum (strain ATCC 11539 / FP-39264 / Madison 617) TaxID=670483 RepID=S7RLC7_GLOTA|nr:uncharacterized protein GLOTRDRAFT_139704 [Gloeophyllum trabeum ATCC 11539]EPQ53469.1 hypothetical protein GLOTRDRAFT_139704 [Gloeophyllum trabeum ATCC 11539]
MAPRRPRSISHASQTNLPRRNHEPLPRPPTQPPQPSPSAGLGMSAASRYQHNLKVLRRRDPSIVSIFDQFSHVCLYHHNGKAWEKKGFEGSMFLFEREAYPPYGFYILNRMGMEDYIQPMYPEDDMEKQGNFLLYRSYPDYTAKRLGVSPSSLRTTSENFSIPEEDREDRESLLNGTDKKRGSCLTVGFWMHATDAREHLTDVMLHPYVQKELVYPQEYRHGPDRPPGEKVSPELKHLIAAAGLRLSDGARNGTTQTPSQRSQQPFSTDYPHSHPQPQPQPQSQPQTSGMSVLDQLFAKATPTGTPSQSSSDLNGSALLSSFTQPSAPSVQPVTGKALLDTIFASVGNASASSSSSYTPIASSSQPSLNALFASAVSANNINHQILNTSQSQAQGQSQPTPPPPEILSPKPTSSTLPQILNQDVISSLLGLSSRASSTRPNHGSRSSSAMSGSSAGRSRRSGRYEGDNESSADGGSVGSGPDVVVEEAELELSESSTVLDAEESDGDVVVTGYATRNVEYARVNGGVPQLSLYPSRSSDEEGNSGINGDATPRPPLRGMPTSPSNGDHSRPPSQMNGHTGTPLSHHRPPVISAASSSSTVRPPPGQRPPAFESSNGLWPTPLEQEGLDGKDEDVVELDFADTSALSDPEAFSRRLESKSRKNGEKGKGKGKAREGAHVVADGIDRHDAEVKVRDGDKRKKPGRREREMLKAQRLQAGSSRSESPGPSVDGQGGAASPALNGKHSSPPQVSVPSSSSKIDSSVAGVSLLDVLMGHPSASKIRDQASQLGRKEFVQELLTLIYTDKAFVDKLWQDYSARSA